MKAILKSLASLLLFLFAVSVCVPVARSAAPAGETLAILTYNIRYANSADGDDVWPNRIDAVSATIASQDIIGLQEVTLGQLQDLQESLPSFDHYSIGRNDGNQSGEHATILYRRNRFEKIDSGTFWLSQHPQKTGSIGWDAAITRICSWVILLDRNNNRKLFFANTHFDHRGSNARLQSAKLIRERIADLSRQIPVVLVGDFNCLAHSPPYNAIVEVQAGPMYDSRLISRLPPTGPTSTWCGFNRVVPGRMIDHVFVSAGMAVEQVSVLNPKTDQNRFASDHLPVQATLSFDPTAKSQQP